jgi:proteasome accessory factor B
MRVGLSPDLVQWVLGWGGEAEVMSPEELRKMVGKAAQAAAAVYRK